MRESTPESLFATFQENRDPEAFRAVFDVTIERVLRVARSLRSSRSDIDDLVQETYLAALQSADRFDTSRDLTSWLCSIMFHKAQLARRVQRRRPDPERLPEAPPIDPVGSVSRRELTSTIENALETLPPGYRDVLRLRYLELQTPMEIAAQLGRSPSTVRTQLARGTERLRMVLPAGVGLAGLASLMLPRLLAPHLGGPVGPTSAKPLGSGVGALKAVAALALVSVATALLLSTTAAPPPGTAAVPVEDVAVAVVSADQEASARGASWAPPRASVSRQRQPVGGPMRLRLVERETGQSVPWVSFLLQSDRPTRAQTVFHDWTQRRSMRTNDEGEVAFVAEDAAPVWLRFGELAGSRRFRRDSEREVDVPVDRVTPVSGRVVDADGVVRGAEVWAGCGRGVEGGCPPVCIATTDIDGRFRANIVEVDEVGLWARSAGGKLSRIVRCGFRAGPPPEQTLELLPSPVVVRGAVFDGGRRCGRVLVSLTPLTGRSPPDFEPTDAAGEFALRAAVPGRYVLSALAGDQRYDYREIELTTATTSIDLKLQTGARVHGRLVDRAGQPLVAARVLASVAHQRGRPLSRPMLLWRLTETDADGRFELRGVPRGEVRLSPVDQRGQRYEMPKALSRREIYDGSEVEWNLTLGDSNPVDSVPRAGPFFRWQAGGADPEFAELVELGKVTGRVERPFTPSSSLGLFPAPDAIDRESRSVVPSRDGTFTFTDVPVPGHYTLRLIEPASQTCIDLEIFVPREGLSDVRIR
ncbi:MAG: sigma-70 family RNA polymerase sigma factor [Planctomycetota bacterium]